MNSRPSITPYADVDAVLWVLLADVQAALADQVVALYLYGLLASDNFDPITSDIDFVVVTATGLNDQEIARLTALHNHLATSKSEWAIKLEGSYIPQAAMRRYIADSVPRPTLNEGQFYLAPHGYDWVIQRHVLREHGVVVAGPPPQTLIDPVSPDELRHAIRRILHDWWRPLLDDSARLRTSEYQTYAVLSMCRALHGLHFGTIISKPVAARWAQQEFPEWTSLIERALASRPGAVFDHLATVFDLIHFVVSVDTMS